MITFVDAVNDRLEKLGITKSELARRMVIAQSTSLRGEDLEKRVNSQRVHLRALLNAKGGNCKFSTADEIAAALGTTTSALLKARRRQRQAARA